MPTPAFPHAALRVFCEPARGEHDGAGVIDVRVPAEPPATRSGANVRALVPVTRECSIASLTIVLEERWRSEIGAELVLVTPSGRAIRVETGSPARLGAHQTNSRDVVDARGLSSAGLWEIVRPRAAGRVTIGDAGLQIDCAPRSL